MKKFWRPLILLFWLALFFGILYLPKWELLKLEDKTISVFAWGDILEPSVVAAFEKETGINVHLNFYYSNEELYVKLKATGGVGYDLVVPSDYTVPLLTKENLLKPLDHSKLPFLSKINPHLLGRFYDPKNTYSIPFSWEIYGFGIDTTQIHPTTPSWDLIFTPPHDYKITMINDPIEGLGFASFYLFGAKDKLTPPEALQVKNLLTEQKEWVLAYTQNRGDYFLATKNCPLVLTTSTNAARTMRLFPFVDFVLPKEGTFISVENFCIPSASQKAPLVYQFINYLYREESIKKHFLTYRFFPALTLPLSSFEPDPRRMATYLQAADYPLDKTHFLRKLLPQRQIQELWIEVKSN